MNAPWESTSPFNRCNCPPWVIGSPEFQEHPVDLEIDGARETDRRLFRMLDEIANPELRGQVFHDYISVKFRLHEWEEHDGSARSSLRHSYVQFLHSWGMDSNSRAGAVLKSWVESRFGLKATFHREVLTDNLEAQEHYWHDRMKGSAKTMGVSMQFDLLYTFCQDELRRRHPGKDWLTLYRGTHDPEEYALRKTPDGQSALVQLNNLSSFTSDREIAWEFGSSVWEVRVPLPKIVFFSSLLPRHLLGGEAEYLVLGGTYQVKPLSS